MLYYEARLVCPIRRPRERASPDVAPTLERISAVREAHHVPSADTRHAQALRMMKIWGSGETNISSTYP